ncbi:hypothetical protein NDU88_002581 [Pleurodeles waltl]|uniref:Uncharacterized protein n=1 Tax=Pleurodeles waltl TaxID=8319 RepID=A0AAV7W4Z8_PLEWA|nr:hypothetical protein NDU88_002581 [Pleurodeles waltl]
MAGRHEGTVASQFTPPIHIRFPGNFRQGAGASRVALCHRDAPLARGAIGPEPRSGPRSGRGRRPGPQGGPSYDGLLNSAPEGPRTWRAQFGTCKQRDRSGGLDTGTHERFGRGERPCLQDVIGAGEWRPPP